MKTFHLIKVSNFQSRNNRPPMVRLTSEVFTDDLIIPYENKPGSPNPALDSAVAFLKRKKINVVGVAFRRMNFQSQYIITNQFIKLNELGDE